MDKFMSDWKAKRDKEVKDWEDKQVKDEQDSNASAGAVIFFVAYLIFFVALALNAKME